MVSPERDPVARIRAFYLERKARMKYQKGTRRRAIEYEKDLVKYWKENKIFEKSIEQRPADNAFVFYDGPPFISGAPHHGTLLSSIVKDAVPRYQTMKGKRVERVWGWDCHGLPAERFTEKKLGIHSRQEVLEYGIEKYINATRENMVQTSGLWEEYVDRIGRWVDFKGAYKTMDKDYMESIWWAFKTLYEKGKIYEGEKVLMYCTLDGTPLSKAEVTMDAGAYQDVTDPSVYIKFKLQDGRYLLAWTTTPWTLPANTAVAVNRDVDYVEVQIDGQSLILAKDLVEKVMTDEKHQPLDYKVVNEFRGEDLVGQTYEPLFVDRGENAHKVWHADYVEIEAGTGIVHLAPIYGEEDFELAKHEGFPAVHVLDQNGFYTEGEWEGQNVWEVNKPIAKELKERGIVWKIEYYRHSYPHCHRCGTKLMYRAHPSWFMDIDSQREKMLEGNESINWFPKHLKYGRFAKTIEQAPDWNISRDRFWATAMPVWKTESGKTRVVGSYAELKELSGVELEDYHRPWVDDVTFEIDGELYTRIDKVMDSWFEAGSMPFAQLHYPFENKEKFEANFPGDFIVEYIAQTRAWFYYMHAVNIALFDTFSFKNVITTGTLAGNDGRKMSKSLNNFTDPNELMDKYSADAERFLLLSCPVLNGEDYSLQDKEVGDVARKLSMIWNMYDFFTMYAEVDGWEFTGDLSDPSEKLTNLLDIWIVSRVHQLTGHIEKYMDVYDIPNALEPVLPFLDDASNWYVRRSRRRFWKSEDDGDKNDAYKTLHYVLVRLSLVLAPFTPFLAEELYRKLTNGESVHLNNWPEIGAIDDQLVDRMSAVRNVVTTGLAWRAKQNLKVRQPLSSVFVQPEVFDLVSSFEEIVLEELNVKRLEQDSSLPDDQVVLDAVITKELKAEGYMREIVRHIQNARKEAGLEVDDRIIVSLESNHPELAEAIITHLSVIHSETLGTAGKVVNGHSVVAVVDGQELKIGLEKA